MSSPQEVAAKVWGGKPEDYEVLFDVEELRLIEAIVFKKGLKAEKKLDLIKNLLIGKDSE